MAVDNILDSLPQDPDVAKLLISTGLDEALSFVQRAEGKNLTTKVDKKPEEESKHNKQKSSYQGSYATQKNNYITDPDKMPECIRDYLKGKASQDKEKKEQPAPSSHVSALEQQGKDNNVQGNLPG